MCDNKYQLINAISSERVFTTILFNEKDKVSALYDTGAAVTVFDRDTFKLALKTHNVGQKVDDHGLTLTDASRGQMQIDGVYFIRFTIKECDKVVRVPVVVCSSLSSRAIIGMNVIQEEGLMYNPKLRRVVVAEVEGPKIATVVLCRPKTVQPKEAQLVTCTLVLEDGSTVPEGNEFMAEIRESSIWHKTGPEGKFSFYLANPSCEELHLARAEKLGTARDISNFEQPVQPTEEVVATIFGEETLNRRQKITRGVHNVGRISWWKRKFIAENVARTVPNDWFYAYNRLLLKNF
jgi:hypothetical protein